MLVSMSHLTKAFSGIPVLQDVGFDLSAGEVHILAGENGAGKTTLIKILAGIYRDYRGIIEVDGRRVCFASPHDANLYGISVIHQEMSLIGTLPVIDNIFLGREIPRRFSAGLLADRARQSVRARELCLQLGLDIDLSRPVDDFPLPVKYRIEIAKALAVDARILIMDEPTGALSEPEVGLLFQAVQELRRRGKGIIYITHRMEEIYRIGDRITVLRNGRRIGTTPVRELPQNELIRWMIGGELAGQFPPRRAATGEGCFQVEHFSIDSPGGATRRGMRRAVDDASLLVRSGEVLGLAGLQGSGNGDLLAGLFGAHPGAIEGDVYLDGRRIFPKSPEAAMRHGIAYVTSDRKSAGLVLTLNVAQNISLASLRAISPWGLVDRKRESEVASRQVRSLSIRGADLGREVQTLSGGNQQKVLLAKWIETRPRVFLLDEPTRGIDVGVKHEIYDLIGRWKSQGIAMLLITSELQELLGLADRIMVMHRGRITAELTWQQATQEKILRAAMGETCAN